MAIKFLRGIYGRDQVKTTRPVGFKFPLGLTVSSSLDTANSSTTATLGTVDVFLVAGGGQGGGSFGGGNYNGGGGGGGGVRILTANSFTEMSEVKNPAFITEITNFIPVVVGGSSANSCFGSNFIACRGGAGGGGQGGPGASGGSGGGGGRGCEPIFGFNVCGLGGTGITGQGCNGGNASAAGQASAAGGAATCSASPTPCLTNTNGLTTLFTGTSIKVSDGGGGMPTPTLVPEAAVNRGGGGAGGRHQGVNSAQPIAGRNGGSGIVAVRYCNPAAPTTPLATGGTCVCCTGGCIIHIFNSSGFLNVNTSFSIN